MEATNILSSEHRVIERVAAALDIAADRLDNGAFVRPGFFVDAARFARDFADGFHHAKEEGVLFASLGRHGFPTDGGPVAVMLYEHGIARTLTAGLGEAAERLANGESAAAAMVAEYGHAYADLLMQHIAKEDGILFPMAGQAIPSGERDALLEGFRRVEREQAAHGSGAEYLDLAAALCSEMGVDADAIASRAVALPCHAR